MSEDDLLLDQQLCFKLYMLPVLTDWINAPLLNIAFHTRSRITMSPAAFAPPVKPKDFAVSIRVS